MMTDLEHFAEDAIYDVFAATVKDGAPVSFETACKYIVEGKPGIIRGPFNGDTNMKMSPVFKGYCKKYWNYNIDKYTGMFDNLRAE
tara:strand:- start:8 stop:265 length:258 start_codon:yes stop_codon:yes gene_type:complete